MPTPYERYRQRRPEVRTVINTREDLIAWFEKNLPSVPSENGTDYVQGPQYIRTREEFDAWFEEWYGERDV
jgi:hypothetical protein